MHYRNGTKVEVGDKIVGRDREGNPLSGFVVSANAGLTDWLQVQPIRPEDFVTAPAVDCLRVGDFLFETEKRA